MIEMLILILEINSTKNKRRNVILLFLKSVLVLYLLGII